MKDELDLLAEADARARRYLEDSAGRRAFPDAKALEGLAAFQEPLPGRGRSAEETLALLDEAGSPATVASNAGRYFGFVIGAALPAAAAADRLALAWDQCASSRLNSPAAAAIEKVAAGWVLDALDLPRGSAVGFGTSASAAGLACLAAARRTLLLRRGWDLDAHGVHGAPEVKVVLSALAHVTIKKALRILGFGTSRIVVAPVDAHGRVDPARLPPLDDLTILCLQAGEVNTGEFDPFAEIVPLARCAGAWVHVDGAFGLWARAAPALAHLTEGVDGADSWTTDGHKWLNTPYDGAVAICRDAAALAAAMNSDASYLSPEPEAQRNLTLEFSRRPRGIAIWAALRSLGREGVTEMVERHCRQARRMADGLRAAGFTILNRVLLNQVLVRASSDEQTLAIQNDAQASGEIWFGGTLWEGRPAFRLSLSSWRTSDEDIERAIALLGRLKEKAH
jgi:glutamate/tyrosine decarboxylase-like PLP-dependent enzyme